MADEWFVDTLSWTGITRAIVSSHPVFLRGLPGTVTTPDDVFLQLDALVGTPEPRTVYLEREGLVLESQGINPSEIKLITAVYPLIQGTAGEVFTFYFGGEFGQPTSGVNYFGPFTYILGTTTKIDCVITCRYPAYTMSTNSLLPFAFQSIGFEFESVGQD